MADPAPYLKVPLRLDGGTVDACDLEESIRQNILLILASPVQGVAKLPGVAADPEYGADLPHHEFRQGSTGEVVRHIKQAVARLEPRLHQVKIDFASRQPGRYLPYRYIRITGKVRETDLQLELEFDVES